MTTKWLGAGLALVLAWSGAALAQEIQLELGFSGVIVAGHWNPLRLTLRDSPEAELYVVMDQGSLRGGEVLAEYRRALPGGSGLQVIEDDIYVPHWRSLSWYVRTADRVLASGSYDRRQLDDRPLTLLLSARPSSWLARLGSARSVDVSPFMLPERLAAYDGVSQLVVDGSTAAPSAEALVAAAAAGATVSLVEPLPASYAELLPLLGTAEQPLGAGRLRRFTEAPDVLAAEAELLAQALRDSVLASEPLEPPKTVSSLAVLIVASSYALAVLLMLRFAGAPGLLTSLVLAAAASFVGWSLVRSGPEQQSLTRSLIVGQSELAREDALRQFFSYPASTLELPLAARPSEPRPYIQHGERLQLELARWESLRLWQRPRLLRSSFVWQDGQLVNRGARPLQEVYVKGRGPQGTLASGESLSPSNREDGPLASDYQALLALLPPGSALARDGHDLLVALAAPPLLGSLP